MKGRVDLVHRNRYSTLLSFVDHQLLLLKTFQPEEIFYLECSMSSSPALKS